MFFESGSERIPRGLPRGKRANWEHSYSLRIGDSPELAAENLQYHDFHLKSTKKIKDGCLQITIDMRDRSALHSGRSKAISCPFVERMKGNRIPCLGPGSNRHGKHIHRSDRGRGSERRL
jgi:hypothetical protein